MLGKYIFLLISIISINLQAQHETELPHHVSQTEEVSRQLWHYVLSTKNQNVQERKNVIASLIRDGAELTMLLPVPRYDLLYKYYKIEDVSIIEYATWKADVDFLTILLELKSDPEIGKYIDLDNNTCNRDKKKFPFASMLVYFGTDYISVQDYTNILRAYVQIGGDINKKDDEDPHKGQTALAMAAGGRVDDATNILTALIIAGADENISLNAESSYVMRQVLRMAKMQMTGKSVLDYLNEGLELTARNGQEDDFCILDTIQRTMLRAINKRDQMRERAKAQLTDTLHKNNIIPAELLSVIFAYANLLPTKVRLK